MRSHVAYAALVTVLLTFLSSFEAASRHRSPERREGERLVHEALETEVQGNPALRDQLLERALDIDSQYELAKWHTGHVKLNGKWQTLEELVRKESVFRQSGTCETFDATR